MSDDEDQLKELLSQAEAIEAEISAPVPSELAILELQKQIRALESQRRSLELQKEKERVSHYDKRMEKMRLEREARELQARINLRRENERQAAALASTFAAMDERTVNCKWRTGVVRDNGDVFKIMEHQLYGAHFLASAKRAICADEMGLGKTIESIAALDMLGAKRVLIIAPNAVTSNFAREVKQWSPTRAVISISRQTKADVFDKLAIVRQALNNPDIPVDTVTILVNYEAWSRNKKLLEVLESFQFDSVICDEAHRIKEMTTAAYKGVAQIVESQNTCGSCGNLVHKEICLARCGNGWDFKSSIANLIFLTGTPILNRPTEIYPLLHLLNPRIFYSMKSFMRSFLVEVAQNDWRFQEGGLSKLAAKLQGIYLRRTIDDTDIVLPPQDVQFVELDLDPAEYPLQAQIIEMLREYAQIIIDDNPAMDQMSQLALITRQRQAAVWPGGIKVNRHKQAWNKDGSLKFDAHGNPVMEYDMDGNPIVEKYAIGDYFRESIKLDVTMEKIKQYVGEGRRIVVFSQFAEVIKEIIERCERDGIRAADYYGATKYVDREAIQRNFDRSVGEKPKWEVVVAHYRTGGEGVNFTAASHMIITDQEWNGGKEDQAMKRISRIGQTERTTVEILKLNDNIDVWLDKLVKRKRKIVEGFNEENQTYQELNAMLTGKFDE